MPRDHSEHVFADPPVTACAPSLLASDPVEALTAGLALVEARIANDPRTQRALTAHLDAQARATLDAVLAAVEVLLVDGGPRHGLPVDPSEFLPS